MPGKFLVASADAGTREAVRRAFAKFSVEAEVCENAVEAFARLNRRYDGVVLDCEDLELGLQLIRGVRHSHEASATAVIALLPSGASTKQALDAGATLALYKPVRPDQLAVSLRVSLRLTTTNEKAAVARTEQAAVIK